jgi:NAD(P)-dependent dehydrogenase (short-subunit alcohol dehydrogenase family)
MCRGSARILFQSIPLDRIGESEEDTRKAAAFLAFDECKYMTEQTFIVDGGSIMLH